MRSDRGLGQAAWISRLGAALEVGVLQGFCRRQALARVEGHQPGQQVHSILARLQTAAQQTVLTALASLSKPAL